MERNTRFGLTEQLIESIHRSSFLFSVMSRPGLYLCIGVILIARFSCSLFLPTDRSLLIALLITIPVVSAIGIGTALAVRANTASRVAILSVSVRRFYLLIAGLLPVYAAVCLVQTAENQQSADQFHGTTGWWTGRVLSFSPASGDGTEWCNVDFQIESGPIIRLMGPAEQLQAGALIQAEITFSKPTGRTNPGGFSQSEYLAGKGIFLTGKVVQNASVRTIKEAGWWRPLHWSSSIRQHLGESAERALGIRQGRLLRALIFGDAGDLEPIVGIHFRRAGLGHLTSVSGAHVSFVLVPLTGLAGLMFRKRRMTLLIQISTLCLYGFITGWRTGAFRAILMAVIFLSVHYHNRLTDGLNSLGVAAAILVLINRYVVLQTGFWMSFMAATILISWSNPFAVWIEYTLAAFFRRQGAFLHRVSQALAAVILLQLALLPLTGKLSGEVFVLSWLANLPALALVSLIFIVAMPGLPLMTALQWWTNTTSLRWAFLTESAIAAGLRLLIEFPLSLLQSLAERVSGITWFRIPMNVLNPLIGIGVACLCISFWHNCVLPLKLQSLHPNGSCRQQKVQRCHYGAINWNRQIVRFALACLAAGCLLVAVQFARRPDWTFYYLDVGQGDAIMVVHRSGKTVLVDGGPAGSGYYDILPAMTHLGIRQIDMAILTHGHNDHMLGLIELVNLGFVEELALPWLADPKMRTKLHQFDDPSTATGRYLADRSAELLHVANHHSIPVQFLEKHDTISLAGQAFFEVLSPDRTIRHEQIARDENDASVILAFFRSDFRMLLLADLSEWMELKLNGQWPDVDVIKVAHHGSGLTTGSAFLQQTSPDHAVISVGSNFYGHPSPALLERLQTDCVVWRTDQHGCIRLTLSRTGYGISAYRPQ